MGPSDTYWRLIQALNLILRGDYESLGYEVRQYLANTAESNGPNAADGWVTARLEELLAKRETLQEKYLSDLDKEDWFQRTRGYRDRDSYAEADIIEFCLIFLGTDPGYAETVARRRLGGARVGKTPWVSNGAKWLAMRSSFSGSSHRAGAPDSSPALHTGQEVSPGTAVPSGHAPAQPPGQTPMPVERAPEEGPRNEGEESGTRLFDDAERASVRAAMMELAEKKYGEFDEEAQHRFIETVQRFVKDDEEFAIALMTQISIEIGVTVGDLSFEQVDQYMRANPAMLEMSPIMQIFTVGLRSLDAAEILLCLRSHPEIVDGIVHKIYVQSVLPTLLLQSGTWQIETHFADGKIEISKDWWFRSDGTCGTEGATGTWCAADYGRLSVKSRNEFIYTFSDLQVGYYFTGTAQERGSSMIVNTVWRAGDAIKKL